MTPRAEQEKETYTLRELREYQRMAFVDGWFERINGGVPQSVARHRYPFPRITRPRVVTLGPYGWPKWMYRDGRFWTQPSPFSLWHPAETVNVTSEAVEILHSLIANPTEEVDDA